MKFSRREALQTGVGIGVASLAGCSSINSFSEDLTVELLNYDDNPHTLSLQILKADAEQYTEGIVHSKVYDLPARGDDPSVELLEDVVVSDKYLIRAHLLESEYEVFNHYHYYPDCSGSSTRELVGIKIEKNAVKGLFIDFDQSRCG